MKKNGQFVVRDDSPNHTEICGKREYNTGRYQLHFRIERLDQKGWIFFGTISKSPPMRTVSLFSSSSYGWSNQNQIYAGDHLSNKETIEIIHRL